MGFRGGFIGKIFEIRSVLGVGGDFQRDDFVWVDYWFIVFDIVDIFYVFDYFVLNGVLVVQEICIIEVDEKLVVVGVWVLSVCYRINFVGVVCVVEFCFQFFVGVICIGVMWVVGLCYEVFDYVVEDDVVIKVFVDKFFDLGDVIGCQFWFYFNNNRILCGFYQ